MTYDILATGSNGNAVVINGEILIDCGVPMKKLRESGYVKSLQLVLLTHAHGDHFNSATVRALHCERPKLRWGCCEWMAPHLLKAGVDKRVIHVYDADKRYDYAAFGLVLTAQEVPHDVPNCCYHLFFAPNCSLLARSRATYGDLALKVEGRMFYATDAGTLDAIAAPRYDLYLIESNHTRAEIEARIAEKLTRGEFAYEARAARNHLSREAAQEWLARNAGAASEVVFLHGHRDREDKTGLTETNT